MNEALATSNIARVYSPNRRGAVKRLSTEPLDRRWAYRGLSLPSLLKTNYVIHSKRSGDQTEGPSHVHWHHVPTDLSSVPPSPTRCYP